MAFINIAVTNQSTVLTDVQVQSAIPALQTQIHRDFAPVWGIDANLSLLSKGTVPSASDWMLGIFDDTDQAGALGYHELSPSGTPLAKVFAKSDAQAGLSWTVTASHEALEMLGDPFIDLTVFDQSTNNIGTLYAYEACDAVESDSLGYSIGGTAVSDFVYPTWFEANASSGVQFDFGKHTTKPLELLPGGYIGVFNVTAGSGWQQITSEGPTTLETFNGRVDSRLERRMTPKADWRKSNPRI